MLSEEDPAQLFNDALDALDQGKVDTAISHLEAFLAMEPEDDEAIIILAKSERSVGRLQSAERRLSALLERSPLEVDALV